MTTETYRLLEPHETIKEGDEWSSYWLGTDGGLGAVEWTVESCDIGRTVGTVASRVLRKGTCVFYRRKLSQAQPDFRWIPVTERVPGELDNVFVPVLVKGWCRPGFGRYSFVLKGFDLNTDNCAPFCREGAVVTHWMELPPAPKPEPTREDRQVEAFERAMGLKLPTAPSTFTVACNIGVLADAFRKALAVT